MKKLHEMIHDLRKEHNAKQIVIADYLGVSQQAYSNYENGCHKIPVSVVIALSRYYKVSTDYLLHADTSYLGSANLNNDYLEGITMHDIMYDIQHLEPNKRKELVKYIQYLNHI